MTESDQAHLDADVAAITGAFDEIEAEIETLRQTSIRGAGLDFTALDAAVARAKGDEPAPEPTPEPAPEAPVETAPVVEPDSSTEPPADVPAEPVVEEAPTDPAPTA